MGANTIFKRVEMKYMLTDAQYAALLVRIAHMAEVDEYGKSTILNIYYDTPDYRLIRDSIDKPLYKEKLRLRSYGTPTDDSTAFVEIKKKYKGIVYKRRVLMPYGEALSYLAGQGTCDSQIGSEIDYFVSYYKGLAPRMAISYDRIAMKGTKDPDLRITFDTNIRYRTNHLDLKYGNEGREILEPGYHLMEIKIKGAMDLELAHILEELKIYKTSFSKYGTAYKMHMTKEPVRIPVFTPAREKQRKLAYA